MGVRVHSNTNLVRIGIILMMFMAVLSKDKNKHPDEDMSETQIIEENTGESTEETEDSNGGREET